MVRPAAVSNNRNQPGGLSRAGSGTNRSRVNRQPRRFAFQLAPQLEFIGELLARPLQHEQGQAGPGDVIHFS